MAIELYRPGRSIRPWNTVDMMQEMERHFEDMFGRSMMFPAMLGQVRGREGTWMPALDMIEKDDKFIVKAEVPGMKKEEIDVAVTGDTLTIKGERKTESEAKEEQYHLSERSYGSFFRSITIPSSVDATNIQAAYEDGVLEVTLPKAPEVKPKKIDVSIK